MIPWKIPPFAFPALRLADFKTEKGAAKNFKAEERKGARERERTRKGEAFLKHISCGASIGPGFVFLLLSAKSG